MPSPIYKVFNREIGTFIQWFVHDETEGQINAALEYFIFPRGHFELLTDDGTEADYLEAIAQWEDLRPLATPLLATVR